MDIKVIYIHNNLVDVFHGEGWEEDKWVRLRKTKGRWEYANGNKSFLRPSLDHITKESNRG